MTISVENFYTQSEVLFNEFYNQIINLTDVLPLLGIKDKNIYKQLDIFNSKAVIYYMPRHKNFEKYHNILDLNSFTHTINIKANSENNYYKDMTFNLSDAAYQLSLMSQKTNEKIINKLNAIEYFSLPSIEVKSFKTNFIEKLNSFRYFKEKTDYSFQSDKKDFKEVLKRKKLI